MNPEEFKNRVMMPPMPEPEVEMPEPEEPEHPNTPILENLLVTIEEKTNETNEILGHILVKLDDDEDKVVNEHKLLKQAEVVDALKELTNVVKQNNQWEVNLILE